jgi:hypothetical protein
MFTSRQRMDKLIFTKLGMLIPYDQEEVTGRSKLWKTCPKFQSK